MLVAKEVFVQLVSEEKIHVLGENLCSAKVCGKEIIFRNEHGTFWVREGDYIQVYPHEG